MVFNHRLIAAKSTSPTGSQGAVKMIYGYPGLGRAGVGHYVRGEPVMLAVGIVAGHINVS